jgi:hypothetical protein
VVSVREAGSARVDWFDTEPAVKIAAWRNLGFVHCLAILFGNIMLRARSWA